MRRLPAVILTLVLAAALWSCRKERESFVRNVDPTTVPTMTTTDVSTFISDSGYTRYHITAPLWQMFEDAEQPHWKFPGGIELEQYDRNLKPAANMSCDSATYFSARRLWRLDGHVVMVNTLRDTFLTQQLFWDQARQLVYSDSFIHIVRSSHIIEGYGFESNQTMSQYTVNRPTGIIPVNRPEGGASPLAPAPAPGTPRPVPVRSSEQTPEAAAPQNSNAAMPLKIQQSR